MTTITLTGIDERTDLEALDALAAEHIRAEFGILYSAQRTGKEPRYPAEAAIASFLGHPGLKGRCALHICGAEALESALNGGLSYWLAQVPRFQINGPVRPDHVAQLCRDWPHATIITQHNVRNAMLCRLDAENHSLLFDESGGRGKKPERWERPPIPEKAFGYAGGLGPYNIAEEAQKIGQVANPGWWVDMESSLRGYGDWFDAEKARAVLESCRGLKPLGGEFWLHSIHGAVAVLGWKNGHVIGICRGRQRALELGLLLGRLCLRPEGFYLEDPAGKRDTHAIALQPGDGPE